MSAQIIYITGAPGAGKDTLARVIARGLLEEEGARVSLVGDVRDCDYDNQRIKHARRGADYVIVTGEAPTLTPHVGSATWTLAITRGGRR